ncbi:cytochrome C oxidase subunit IV family protein [Desulfoprunum benzoelyticum]|uniref:Cytochrome c oxidase subunit 4 n=1 Tax=Desulfoprunum benzoelyticum TaxID=1506996 RepID=A0A840UVH9_9BACT|nr:cytochrome C oxidase subunit IV family protein [Desulfoprunum benzoelyticum]MBB5348843.1 cytochrome c oxidase subunit 4 [Desulfoprunum benzoelyticum]MBM9530083.1 cytochrome C oxidase subunit IV family protein [Desulfoprunum benzoelyticum]
MESSEEHRHIVGYGQLAVVLALLLALTGVTVAVSYIDLGFLNVPAALTIATLKAALVLLFFMHLRYEGPIIRYGFITTVMFLAIMIGFTFWDVAFR